MQNRTIALLVALAISLASVVVMAQLRGHIPRFGVLDPSFSSVPPPVFQPFSRGYATSAMRKGRTLLIDYRHAEGQALKQRLLASEVKP